MPGSVAFLNSGKTVHPILPKSQCWCVDGKTKFALRIRGDNYYRIELPSENDTDQRAANDFKIVLAKILQYESTPCPFKRGFYVELPEKSPQTPKKPWTPKHTPTSLGSPFSPEVREEKERGRNDKFTSGGSLTIERSGSRCSSSEWSFEGKENNCGESKSERESPGNAPDKVERLVASFEVLRSTHDTDRHASTLERWGESDEESQMMPQRLQLAEKESLASIDATASVLEDVPPLSTTESVDESIIDDSTMLEPDAGTLSLESTVDTLSETVNALQAETSSFSKKPEKEELDGMAFGVSMWLDTPDDLKTPSNFRPSNCVSSGTAPLNLTRSSCGHLVSSSQTFKVPSSEDSGSKSIASSIESHTSFHSFHRPTSPLPPSPPYTEGSPSPPSSYVFPAGVSRIQPHQRGVSELTITAGNFQKLDDTSIPDWLGDSPVGSKSGALDSKGSTVDDDEESFRTASAVTTPERRAFATTKSSSSSTGHRLSRGRAHSPLPSSANIYIPPTTLTGHLTNVILQKTRSLLLGPPIQLVALMLNLASRFAIGALQSQPFTYGDSGQPIPCSWGDDGDVEYDSDNDDDDYGISLGGTPDLSRRKRHSDKGLGSNWDID